MKDKTLKKIAKKAEDEIERRGYESNGVEWNYVGPSLDNGRNSRSGCSDCNAPTPTRSK